MLILKMELAIFNAVALGRYLQSSSDTTTTVPSSTYCILQTRAILTSLCNVPLCVNKNILSVGQLKLVSCTEHTHTHLDHAFFLYQGKLIRCLYRRLYRASATANAISCKKECLKKMFPSMKSHYLLFCQHLQLLQRRWWEENWELVVEPNLHASISAS